MGKLLAWGGALFLVRYELGELQIQRVQVDAEQKKASLRLCNVTRSGEAAALPADARLIAAKEVEDAELATRYPVLVFQVSQVTEGQVSSPASRKRRRSGKAEEVVAADDVAVSTLSRNGDELFFCMLYETEDDNEIGLCCLNALEVPRLAEASGNEVVASADDSSLQVFVTDGPYILLFERLSQLATLLKLQRARTGDGVLGFYAWCKRVNVVKGAKDDLVAPFEVVSCTYVSEMRCSTPHMLIHAQRLSSPSAADSETQFWSTLDLSGEREDRTSGEITSKCRYLAPFPPTTGYDRGMSMRDEVSCCCFISELSEWDFAALSSSETAAFTSWDRGTRNQPSQADLGVSTLLVTGTTSNTIYVHTNGILLVSYILPTRPAEMWCMCEDKMDQRYVLCVRCDDANQSFFMLGFSSKVQHISMELLLSFNHVGHAFTGHFAAVDGPTLTQLLLLNDVPDIVDMNGYNQVGMDKSLDDGQLVKRSVLVMQKASAPETKLSCHRLRLREEKKNNHGSRSRKRTRSDDKASSKGDSTHSKPELFRHIERTQKASSRDRSLNQIDEKVDCAENALAASHAQLGKLASSLSARLRNGVQELERLQMIVGDKHSLVHQLNHIISRQWRKQQEPPSPSKEYPPLLTLLKSPEDDNLRPEPRGLVEMETMVNAPTIPKNVTKSGPGERDSNSSWGELKLAQQVSLEQFSVVEYVPSSSLIHAEVILNNLSDKILNDTFVVLTAPKGGLSSTQAWKCSCLIVPEFPPAANVDTPTRTQPGKARFQVDLQLAPNFTFLRARMPLEVTLWLHWGAVQDGVVSETTLDWRPSESGLAVAFVKIHPDEVLDASRELPTRGVEDWRGGRTFAQQEQEQLLFISSGSNLASWFGKPSFDMATSAASVIRSTFALVGLCVRSRELMLFKLSRMVANLPSDVYVMRNPFQQTHLHLLQCVLRSMRQEIIAVQRQPTVEKQVRAKEKNHALKIEGRDPASLHRAMQRNTDCQVTQLLLGLQKRVNFHTMWFDGNAIASNEDE